ncbi:uncharacterized protein LOC125377443 isoform X2 [Haliotis rufescens]|uniref:uncharacterized protein LOC125377443 isoform X2 n=1 Tax=Haliotis rufescens TaxID=6454 RepID=UPI00201F0B8E|nr:uncharacterized protein LOC125377443 isoform X2 [Haliotis rufescens]
MSSCRSSLPATMEPSLPYTDILQQNHTFLKEILDVGPVLEGLYTGHIFTLEDYETCKSKQTVSEKIEMLLLILRRKGPNGYVYFRDVLATSQPHVKKRLDETKKKTGHMMQREQQKEPFDELKATSHVKILKRNSSFLVKNLELKPILDKLYELKIFSEENKQDCNLKEGTPSQIKELISILERKGRSDFDSFLHVLGEIQPFIKDHLKGLEDTTTATDTLVFKQKAKIKELEGENDIQKKHIASLQEMIEPLQESLVQLRKEKADSDRERQLLKQRNKYLEGVQNLSRDETPDRERIKSLLGSLSNMGLSHNVTPHLLKSNAVDNTFVLQCIHLKYDKDRVNPDYVHINTEGDLVNRKSDTRPAGEGRLKKYRGTCSTAPLPRAGCPQYWEMVSRVSLDKPLTETNLILEVGVCWGEQRDVSHCINALPSSYCMQVAHCTTHGGICRQTWKEEKRVVCLPDTLPNTAGSSHTLHYGVVYDDATKKIVFIDVKENKVMSTLDNVDSSQPLWPMFGVYMPLSGNVSMTLVVGSDINMTEEKKAMIVKALS